MAVLPTPYRRQSSGYSWLLTEPLNIGALLHLAALPLWLDQEPRANLPDAASERWVDSHPSPSVSALLAAPGPALLSTQTQLLH